MRFELIALVAILSIGQRTTADVPQETVLQAAELFYEFQYIDYTWTSIGERRAALATGAYIPRFNLITGIKSYLFEEYVSTPPAFPGVPSTLNKVSSIGPSWKRLLQPFPSWDMNRPGDCNALQYVQGFEIVPQTGEMWVMDTGSRHIFTPNPVVKCRPKMVILDMNNGGAVKHYYEFPPTVVPLLGAQLLYIVVDHVRNFAYISDDFQDAIVVYDRNTDTSHRVKHRSMQFDPLARAFVSNGHLFNNTIGVDGIALSPDKNIVYYSALNGFMVYAIPTFVLRSPVDSQNQTVLDSVIDPVFRKPAQSDALVIGSQGNLYFAPIPNNAVYRRTNSGEIQQIVQSDSRIAWPVTLSLDASGYLWFATANIAESVLVKDFRPGTESNFKIWRVFVGETP